MRRKKFRMYLSTLILGCISYTFFNFLIFYKDDNRCLKYQSTKNLTTNFEQILETFPWKLFGLSVVNPNPKDHNILTSKLINQLIPFVTMEPLVPINATCTPPPFVKSNCSNKLSTPRRIAVLLQFGFDVDILEIHLNELFDIVDRFFILESHKAHYGALLKPLVWEIVKNQERFQKFLPKIVHFILDDSDTVQVVDDNRRNQTLEIRYKIEDLQEKIRWEKFQVWNNITGYFRDEDLLGFGDSDEIPSRDVINFLKNCEFSSYPVDIGTWFAFGNIKQAFKPVYHVSKDYRFTHGDPTYWTLQSAAGNLSAISDTLKFPSRNRGHSGSFLLGGMHMTHYGYLPFQIIKRFTLIERSFVELTNITNLLIAHFNEGSVSGLTLRQLEKLFADVPHNYKYRLYDLDELRRTGSPGIDDIAIMPWFYDCNRQRYPAWEGLHDTRLD